MTRPPSAPPSDSGDSADPAPRSAVAGSTKKFSDVFVQFAAIVIGATAVAVLVRDLLNVRPAQSSWMVHVALAVATVAGVCWGAWQRHRLWSLPMRRLGAVVEQVRQGELPVEEISRIGGVPAALVPALRDLLGDLRRQRRELHQLQQEMSQRVANRTDALERALGSLKEKASRDALTGLYNRRMMDETLPRLVDRCSVEHRPLSVLMVDIDYFKQLNDTLGHAAGDELLRAFGQIVRSTIRSSDLAFRCGGDEFVIVVTDSDPASGQTLGERLTSLVDALGKTLRVERRPRLSIGMAHLVDCAIPTAAELLEAADRALYKVKGNRKRAELSGAAPAVKRAS